VRSDRTKLATFCFLFRRDHALGSAVARFPGYWVPRESVNDSFPATPG
jgi:hypothetical protein